jgi:biphenyl 2,3-dioxygenase beta subunit
MLGRLHGRRFVGRLRRAPGAAARAGVNVTRYRPTRADAGLQFELEQFLFEEASLIDERRFDEWLELLADDLDYWMPVRSTRFAGDEAAEFTRPGEVAFFDDDKTSMTQRVAKLRTGFAWSEDPPSRTRHLVANVRIVEKRSESDVTVSCNFLIYRSRLARDEDFWLGRREDALRKTGERWRVYRRHVFLDHVSLNSKNLSVFF